MHFCDDIKRKNGICIKNNNKNLMSFVFGLFSNFQQAIYHFYISALKYKL